MVVAVVGLVIAALVAVAVLRAPRAPAATDTTTDDDDTTTNPPSPEASRCPRVVGRCIERVVTRIVDGDTLDVEGDLRIRLVLVDAPELTETGGPEARDYLTDGCLGALALIDEDDFQIDGDPYGRVLAVVHCRGLNANAVLISSGHADTYYEFCADSEFGNEAWTGCSSRPPPTEDCDPAYPDVCIAPPPPDLDCSDIPYRNFRVLSPDPHRFDGDGDGIGCRS